MKPLLRVAGAALFALAASMFVLDGDASANDGPSCARASGFIPTLCITVPMSTSVRREATSPLMATVSRPVDVRIESGVPTPDDNVAISAEPARALMQDRSMERPELPLLIEQIPAVVFDQADLLAYARAAANRQGIDSNLFVRQINAESAFDPYAVSRAGAVGIAQIMPTMHPGVDPTDPYASLDYAARLMRGYINHYGDWRRALIAYNAGPGRLEPGNRYYLPQSTILSNAFAGGETMRYVAKILGR